MVFFIVNTYRVNLGRISRLVGVMGLVGVMDNGNDGTWCKVGTNGARFKVQGPRWGDEEQGSKHRVQGWGKRCKVQCGG